MNDLGDDMINKVKNVPKIRFSGYTHAWEKRKLGEVATMNARIGGSIISVVGKSTMEIMEPF